MFTVKLTGDFTGYIVSGQRKGFDYIPDDVVLQDVLKNKGRVYDYNSFFKAWYYSDDAGVSWHVLRNDIE